jgi:hypothetical protein
MEEGDGPASTHLVGKIVQLLEGDQHDDAFRMSRGDAVRVVGACTVAGGQSAGEPPTAVQHSISGGRCGEPRSAEGRF